MHAGSYAAAHDTPGNDNKMLGEEAEDLDERHGNLLLEQEGNKFSLMSHRDSQGVTLNEDEENPDQACNSVINGLPASTAMDDSMSADTSQAAEHDSSNDLFAGLHFG